MVLQLFGKLVINLPIVNRIERCHSHSIAGGVSSCNKNTVRLILSFNVIGPRKPSGLLSLESSEVKIVDRPVSWPWLIFSLTASSCRMHSACIEVTYPSGRDSKDTSQGGIFKANLCSEGNFWNAHNAGPMPRAISKKSAPVSSSSRKSYQVPKANSEMTSTETARKA